MRALGLRLTWEERPRRDPAPSRWAYRWQRLMLRPLFRRLVRVGLPVAALSALAGLWITSPANRAAFAATIAELRDEIVHRPEFLVGSVQITGAGPAVTHAVEELLTLDLPVSSFDVDLEGLHAQIAALSAVRSATVAIRPGGILDIAVTERQPVAVWRHSDGLRLIDAEGVLTGMILDRADRADLPLIAGDGAMEVIGEALDLFRVAAPIGAQVRGLVRMGKRRWDLVLEGDLRLMLPEEGAIAALERILALHQAQDLLDRDITAVDLRNPARPTVRLTQSAGNALRNVTALAAEQEAGH